MSVKDELQHLIHELDDEQARQALEYVRWLMGESETLTEAEIERLRAGEAEIERGEYTILEDLRSRLAR
ncbi:MAG: hypothetical protein HY691_14040 [Chloroflexi bacterium]|nr:hypothetical protein [Chloroflexota bacterium]